MAVTFKMKFFLLWICLCSAVFPFPTQSPTDGNKTNDCCVQNPKLIYKGHDSNTGINVYIFEFLPEGKEAKDKRVQGDRSAYEGKENWENREDPIIPTNKPASMYGKKDPHIDTSTRVTHVSDTKSDTNNSTITAVESDIGMYEDTDFLLTTTEGLQMGMSNTKDIQKTGGHSTGVDYYGTEGSALLDIPSYNDTDTDNQGPQVDFPATVKDFSINSGCSKSEGQCNNLPKPTEQTFVIQPATHKDLSYSKTSKDRPDGHTNRERNTMNHTVKWNRQTKKAKKHKSGKQTGYSVGTKGMPIRHNNGKIFQYSSGQRRKTGVNRHNSRSSSSESRSDSSQEFD